MNGHAVKDLLANAATFLEHGKFQEALKVFEACLELDPSQTSAIHDAGICLLQLGQPTLAIDKFLLFIETNPSSAVGHYNLSRAYQATHNYQNAHDHLIRATEIDQCYFIAHYELAVLYLNSDRFSDCIQLLERAFELNPNFPGLHGFLLYARMYSCVWENYEENLLNLLNKIESGVVASAPFSLIVFFNNPTILLNATKQFATTFFPETKNISNQIKNQQLTPRRYKIGYFSNDFRSHATSYLIQDVILSHDPTMFEIHFFSYTRPTQDEWQERFISNVSFFHDISELTDESAADLAKSVGIDIAVDLKGYTGGMRPGIFAHRPAKYIINFLGYPGTMGTTYHDFIIADRHVIPETFERFYTEKVIRLPHCYQPNTRNLNTSDKPNRSTEGLPDNQFVFSSFNDSYKITPKIAELWSRIMIDVPDSVLWILVRTDEAKKNLSNYFSSKGISLNRLIFARKVPHEVHLGRIKLANLQLDTFPCGGHTTTSDAVRAGLPVLTICGDTFASRVASSILAEVNAIEFIHYHFDTYVNHAVKLGNEKEFYKQTVERYKVNVSKSQLFNPIRFVRNLESAYIDILKEGGSSC